ncbi:hypothetical protein A3B02_00500 [Candidatus Roizmanbacteria bacterium RIFCSPLOWO2_01_FULL_42_14]|uniref:Uncharacterized protein n=3 Tax=Candidatus Roizmaniibacteriota TaxID=1752723 RepID=A0A1F7K027_9BACT|nr:MAG: hypothetical protein A3F32_00870 [Candidatus Roizmanbacteria bacterium RIFCSPHIGHO2_12_FULL_42_10]OGK52734.1 MAG: hypothetical protein A3B02_00500 [Candidatus Roizmanbacteria bacterium RIFCSPLOWO2_01_FULL_42_14]OGK61201.1 MAG: hypothetical protein A3I56_03860 [Candidatus Roizmanbacteria bacterium RIFCSPLOWO2_02_FULL_43_10]
MISELLRTINNFHLTKFRFSDILNIMDNTQGTAIIRDRGQFTIPDRIREALKWALPNSVVSLVTTSKNELLIKPYQASMDIDWEQMWKEIYKARSVKGKRGNLSNFITSDRENH